MKKIVVFLFDLDGVLIKPGGYRAASRDTLEFFVRKMDIDVNLPDENVFSLYESASVTNEWDMVPLSLCAIANEANQGMGFKQPPYTLDEFIHEVHQAGIKKVFVHYEHYIDKIKTMRKGGVPPSRAIADAERSTQTRRIFPGLSENLLMELLGATRNIKLSPTTRIFQQLVLGSDLYTQVYGYRAELDSISYLMELDRAQLTPPNRDLLNLAMSKGHLRCSGLTLRPSLPDGVQSGENAIYSPETDLARHIIGWKNLPVIGYGEMLWLAHRSGVNAERLIKPAPVQALCAIGSALGMDVSSAFEWAQDLEAGQVQPGRGPEIDRSAVIEMHVFEDSIVGIQACQKASNLMRPFYNVTLCSHGISEHNQKTQALRAVGATVDIDINTALEKVVSDYPELKPTPFLEK